MSAPHSIEWSKLSPKARETAALVGLRLTAGLNLDEIAPILNAERDRIRFNALPKSGSISKTWITARMRELRREIEATAGEI